MNLSRSILYFALTTEVVCFASLFLFGPNGIAKISDLQHQNYTIQAEVEALHVELAELEKQIDDWYENSFLKEKIAREELQMARDGDEIYLINS